MSERKKINLEVNKPFILEHHDKFWMVISGEADIYYVSISKNGHYTSSLNHLYRAEKGELIFSLLTKPHECVTKLLIVGSDVKLLELNKNDLMEIDSDYLKFHVDKWLLKLAGKLYQENKPRIYKALAAQQEETLSENEIAYPAKRLVWCSIVEGDVFKYAGTVSHNLVATYPYPFPVSDNLWIKSSGKDVKIKILDIKEVFKDNIFFMLSLNDVQEHFYKKIILNDSRSRNGEKERIAARIQNNEEKLNATLHQLGSLLLNNTRTFAF